MDKYYMLLIITAIVSFIFGYIMGNYLANNKNA